MNSVFFMYVPTRIVSGWQQSEQLGQLPQIKDKKCLLLTYAGFTAPKIISGLEATAAVLTVSPEFEENPSLSLVRKLGKFIRENEVDTVIAIGGGSTIDTAKGAVWLAENPKWQPDNSDQLWKPNTKNLIALPSTSGTGSEVTPYSILTDSHTGLKKILNHDSLFPDIAVCDPSLTMSMPSRVTANTGIDALSHAIEALLSQRCQGPLVALAMDACRLIRNYLPRVLEYLQDKEGRGALQIAATEAGIPLACCGTVLVHAIGYGLTHDFGYAHGLANGILLAAFVERAAKNGSERAREILHIFDNDLRGFIEKCGIPTRLTSMEIKPKQLEQWVELGMSSAGRTG
ncbi:iron-containing alcohol dehydrogenase, partial [bacterium]|nr:iron-containing alcohol dehydrogenase [bacterium]